MERCGDRGHVGNGQEKSVPFLSSSHSKRGKGDPREDSTLVIGAATSLRFPFIILVILAIPACSNWCNYAKFVDLKDSRLVFLEIKSI